MCELNLGKEKKYEFKGHSTKLSALTLTFDIQYLTLTGWSVRWQQGKKKKHAPEIVFCQNPLCSLCGWSLSQTESMWEKICHRKLFSFKKPLTLDLELGSSQSHILCLKSVS